MVSKQWCRRWGCKRCKLTPKSFDLSKIPENFGKNPGNLGENPKNRGKIYAKSLKIRAKMAPDFACL